MAIQVTNTSLYKVTAIGDGSSTTFKFDFYNQMMSDDTVHNKAPVGVYSVSVESADPEVPSTSISGSVVTFTWITAPGSGVLVLIEVQLLFSA